MYPPTGRGLLNAPFLFLFLPSRNNIFYLAFTFGFLTCSSLCTTPFSNVEERLPGNLLSPPYNLGHSNPLSLDMVPDLITLMKSKNAAFRERVIETLAKIGNPAIPVLIEALGWGDKDSEEDRRIRHGAREVLIRIGEPTVPFLMNALKSQKALVRANATVALGEIRLPENQIVPILMELAEDRDRNVGLLAIYELSKISSLPIETIPALIKLLQDNDAEIRKFAAIAMSKINPAAGEVIDPLIKAMSDENPEVRCYATQTIAAIGPLAQKAVPHLIKALKVKDGYLFVQSESARALKAIGMRNKEIIRALIEALENNREWIVRTNIAVALGELYDTPSDVIPILIQLLADEKIEVRSQAATALSKIGTPTVPSLIKALKATDIDTRAYAAVALGKMGALAAEAISLLIECFSDQRFIVKEFAASAIDKIDTDGTRAISLLINFLTHQDLNLRASTAFFLGYMNQHSAMVVPPLTKALEDPVGFVRYRAAESLGKIGFPAEEAVPALITTLQDRDEKIRVTAAESLGKINPRRDDVVSALINLLNDESKKVRLAAIVALSQAGPIAKKAVIPLMDLLEVEDPYLRIESAKALTRIYPAILQLLTEAEIIKTSGAIKSFHQLVALLSLTDQLYGQKAIEVLELIEETDRNSVIITKESGISEIIARGVLPTIGMKKWPAGVKIEFPIKPDVTPEDKGVYHNWESHELSDELEEINKVSQVSIHSDWFKGIHLISATQLTLFPPMDRDPTKAPASIDEKEVGFIVGSGGVVEKMEGMRLITYYAKTDRIDFLWGKDLRMIQLLMFAGISTQIQAENRIPQEIVGAKVWERFQEGMKAILTSHGLREFIEQEWFYEEGQGWKSRYSTRYERFYSEIRPGIVQLFNVIRSPAGEKLRQEVKELVEPLLDELEQVIWSEGLKQLPDVLLRSILRSSNLEEELRLNALVAYLMKERLPGELEEAEAQLLRDGTILIPLLAKLYAIAQEESQAEIREIALRAIVNITLTMDEQKRRAGIQKLVEVAKEKEIAPEVRAVALWSLSTIIETDTLRRLNYLKGAEIEAILNGMEAIISDETEIDYSGVGTTIGSMALDVRLMLAPWGEEGQGPVRAIGTFEMEEDEEDSEINTVNLVQIPEMAL